MAINKPIQDRWRAQTLAVRGGTRRSEFGETGEAIFTTSGYVYENAEQAEDAFKDRVDRFSDVDELCDVLTDEAELGVPKQVRDVVG